MYDGVYSQRDFDLAIDGIKRFDDEHKYGIFENDDFLNELQEIGGDGLVITSDHTTRQMYPYDMWL